jgi:hypothetical protein
MLPLEWDITAGWLPRKMKTSFFNVVDWKTAICSLCNRTGLSWGEVAAGLEVLGTLSRSGLLNIASAAFLCDNESAIVYTNRPLTDIIFQRIESDHNLVSTIKDLQENWYRDLETMYEWVKGHTDDLNCELNTAERLSVIAD